MSDKNKRFVFMLNTMLGDKERVNKLIREGVESAYEITQDDDKMSAIVAINLAAGEYKSVVHPVSRYEINQDMLSTMKDDVKAMLEKGVQFPVREGADVSNVSDVMTLYAMFNNLCMFLLDDVVAYGVGLTAKLYGFTMMALENTDAVRELIASPDLQEAGVIICTIDLGNKLILSVCPLHDSNSTVASTLVMSLSENKMKQPD